MSTRKERLMRMIKIAIMGALLSASHVYAQTTEVNPLIALLAKGSDACQVVRTVRGPAGPKMVEVDCTTEAAFDDFVKGAQGIVSYGAGKSSHGFIFQIERK